MDLFFQMRKYKRWKSEREGKLHNNKTKLMWSIRNFDNYIKIENLEFYGNNLSHNLLKIGHVSPHNFLFNYYFLFKLEFGYDCETI